MVIGSCLTGLLFWSFASGGIASGINRTGLANWEKAAYEGWWSNPINHPPSFVLNVLIILAILFYMVRHNFVGCLAVYMAWDVLGGRKTGKPIFRLRPYHEDGRGGLGILSRIMLLVYLSVLIMGFALLFTHYTLPSSTAFRNYLLILFGFIFLILNPLYLFVPHILIKRAVVRYKQRRIEELRSALDRVSADRESAERLVIIDEVKRIEETPESLFRGGRIFLFVVTYVIPMILFIDWVVSRLSHH